MDKDKADEEVKAKRPKVKAITGYLLIECTMLANLHVEKI